MAGTGIFYKEIQSALAGFKAHYTGTAVEFALSGKAVAAVQVAGVCHMQTQSLDHGAAILKVKSLVRVGVLSEEATVAAQFLNGFEATADLFGSYLRLIGILCEQFIGDFLLALASIDQSNGVISQFVYCVNTAAVNIQHDVVAVQFVLMDHLVLLIFLSLEWLKNGL
ncbi:hypothetical protein EVA_04837 [gut metagenome]|uniref:Uncharacterized protein n=1 Tax=gut metagenome TaxID=749906 RepID=J9H127_9ZZZZ